LRFVDTSFWIALQLPRDRNYESARLLWGDRRHPLVTTNHVVGKTWTFLTNRIGHFAAEAFIDRVESSPRVSVHHVDEPLEVEAWQWLRRHDERAYSFVDATSFALMRRYRILEALAFDSDFSAAGFIEVRP
jgi:uncharacterized protein